MFAIVIFGIVFIIYVGILYVSKKYAYWREHGVPHPKATLFFGNVGKMLTLQLTLSDFLNHLYTFYDTCSYVGFYNLLTPAIVLREPEVINEVLIKNFDSFSDNIIRPADPLVETNPFFLSGTRWKTVRKDLAPYLSNSKVKSMNALIENVCHKMVEYIKHTSDCIDVKELAFKYTGENVMSCAYGLDGKSFSKDISIMCRIRNAMSMSGKMSSIAHTLGLFLPNLCKFFKISYLGKPVPGLFKDIILMSIRCREDNKATSNDFVDFLMKSRNENEFDYLGHAMSFFLDGFETTGYLFQYAILELARNPLVQEEARKEVDLVFAKRNTVYTHEALKELVYVENVVYETLRKHPIIKFLNRICTKDHKLLAPIENNSEKFVTIKKGTQIFVPVEAIHRDEKYYPKPNIFDPNRFNEDNRKFRPKLTFLGFGDGPRICLGQQFAVTQIKMGLIAILLNYKLCVDRKTVFPLEKEFYHLSKLPKNKIWINFSPRS